MHLTAFPSACLLSKIASACEELLKNPTNSLAFAMAPMELMLSFMAMPVTNSKI
jgi:hypothetical protein